MVNVGMLTASAVAHCLQTRRELWSSLGLRCSPNDYTAEEELVQQQSEGAEHATGKCITTAADDVHGPFKKHVAPSCTRDLARTARVTLVQGRSRYRQSK